MSFRLGRDHALFGAAYPEETNHCARQTAKRNLREKYHVTREFKS